MNPLNPCGKPSITKSAVALSMTQSFSLHHCGRRLSRPARSAPAGSRRNQGGRPALPSPRSPRLLPSAPPGRRQRHTQHPGAPAVRLGDLDRAHRRREIGAGRKPVPDLVQIILQIGPGLRDRHRVHAGCALVRLDFLPPLPDSPLRNPERLAWCLRLVHVIPPGALPVDQTNQATNDPAPSLRPYYRSLTAKPGRDRPCGRPCACR